MSGFFAHIVDFNLLYEPITLRLPVLYGVERSVHLPAENLNTLGSFAEI